MKISIFQKNDNLHQEYFTIFGKQSFIDDDGYPRVNDDTHAYAKKIKDKKSKNISSTKLAYSFYIKTDPNFNIINPIKLASDPGFDLQTQKQLNKTCKQIDKYTEVNASIFSKYIEFLKTQNTSWLIAAQRELR